MEYFLQCENCSHLNPVQSEYLTFCENCKKKLSNNFRDWSKLHSNKTLEDYKKEVCVTDALIHKLEADKNPAKRDGWKHWINISITISILLGLSPIIIPLTIGNSDLMFFYQQISTQSEVDFNWENADFEDYGMRLESPLPLQHTAIPIPPLQANLISRLDAYSSPPTGLFGIIVMNNEFHPGVQGVSLQAMATGSLMQMKSMPGTSDFQITQSEIEIDGIPGFRQDGSFRLNGSLRKIKAVGLSENQMLWQIIMAYPTDNPAYEEASNRVLESIEIYYDRVI